MFVSFFVCSVLLEKCSKVLDTLKTNETFLLGGLLQHISMALSLVYVFQQKSMNMVGWLVRWKVSEGQIYYCHPGAPPLRGKILLPGSFTKFCSQLVRFIVMALYTEILGYKVFCRV